MFLKMPFKIAIYILLVFFFTTSQVISDDTALYEGISNFTKVLYLIQNSYVEEVDPRKLTASAIQGMLRSLDPYSVYLPPNKFKELEQETFGEFSGIGVELTIRNGVLTVISPVVGTPAYRAGIKPGDQILAIDGNSTRDMTVFEALRLLRGEKGTKVRITVKSAKDSSLREIELTRAVVKIKSVEYELLGKNVGYIKIIQFNGNSADEFLNSFKNMSEKSGDTMKGLILDLRNNPGGLLDQAVEIADYFIEKGVIVSIKGKEQAKNYFATEGVVVKDIPVVVLVNGGSASASEVLTGALKDHKVATVLGTNTFGKGSVQTIVELEDGSGIKLTTALFYTPDGKKINSVGITPDVTVKPAKSKDIQLKRAIELVRSKSVM